MSKLAMQYTQSCADLMDTPPAYWPLVTHPPRRYYSLPKLPPTLFGSISPLTIPYPCLDTPMSHR